MNRVLLGMAVTNYLLLSVTVVVGYLVRTHGDLAFYYHLRLAILTALFSLLAHCLVFTYFLGTTRWVRETAQAYALPSTFGQQSRRCRGRAFGYALASMLLVVLVIATGAGADTKVWPPVIHHYFPYLAYGFMLWAYRVEYGALEEHIALTDQVMVEVNARRQQAARRGSGEPERSRDSPSMRV